MAKGTTASDIDVVPGRKPVMEQLRSAPDRIGTVFIQQNAKGREIAEIIDLCRQTKVRYRVIAKQELSRMFSGNTQGVVAKVASQDYVSMDDLMFKAPDAPLPLIVALDQVQDPGNVGALARTLYALGAAGIIVPKDRAAHLGGAAAKASAGALGRLPVARVTNLSRSLDELGKAGYEIYATTIGHDAVSIYEATLSTPMVLILGNEEKGIRPGVLKRATQKVNIPFQRKFDSLNVAQAGGIITAEFARRLCK